MSERDIVEPTMLDLLSASNDAGASKINGPIPGSVQSYDKTKQIADIKPAVQVWRDGTFHSLPILRGVQVAFPQSGNIAITFPLTVGSWGEIVVQAADMSEWKANGGTDTPARTRRRFSLSDVVFVPGLRTLNNPLPAGAVDDAALVLWGPLIKLISSSAANAVALAIEADARFDAIELFLAGHMHPTAAPGVPSAPTGPAPSGSSVASTKVLIDE